MIALRARLVVPRWLRFAVPAASVLVAILVWSALLLAQGRNPAAAFRTMGATVLGTRWGLGETCLRAVPLVLCAAGVALAASMRLWNIGAQGQLLVGAMAATWVALSLGDLPAPLMLPAMLAAGALAGALWCGACGALRAWLEVSEVLTTLLLNYVAAAWLAHMVLGPWRGPDNFPYTATFPTAAWLPALGGGKFHAGLPLAILAVLLLAVLCRRTAWGYELRVAGESWETARYGGIAVRSRIVSVLAISGAFAGAAGAIQVSAVQHRLEQAVAPGYGYTAILVCWLARGNVAATIPVGFLFAALLVAGDELQVVLSLPAASVQILLALVLLCVLAGDAFVRYRPVLDLPLWLRRRAA
ncbi:MAG: ABC transporter permease [Planctomycetes bacterium]|nr:ABC transporter permease [Planctomycetota bacterium]